MNKTTITYEWGTVTTYERSDHGLPVARVGVFVGHSSTDGGAHGKYMNENEHDTFAPVAQEFGALAAAAGYTVDVFDRVEPEWSGWKAAADELNRRHGNNPYDLHMMLHYNDYNGRASGTMCCYWHTSSNGKRGAHIFAQHIGHLLGLNCAGWDGEGLGLNSV